MDKYAPQLDETSRVDHMVVIAAPNSCATSAFSCFTCAILRYHDSRSSFESNNHRFLPRSFVRALASRAELYGELPLWRRQSVRADGRGLLERVEYDEEPGTFHQRLSLRPSTNLTVRDSMEREMWRSARAPQPSGH